MSDETANSQTPDNPQPAADWRVQQVAGVYAKALLGVTERAGNTSALMAELDEVAGVLRSHPRFVEVLGSPLIGEDERRAMIERVFAKYLSPTAVNFLRVLSQRGRLSLLGPIHRELRRQYDELRGVVPVHVTTATPLAAAESNKLKQALRSLVSGEPRVEASVDPTLIGGAVVRVGDTVYDGSVSRQLEQVRLQMINRSIHEIQSRRDRFRYPSGN